MTKSGSRHSVGLAMNYENICASLFRLRLIVTSRLRQKARLSLSTGPFAWLRNPAAVIAAYFLTPGVPSSALRVWLCALSAIPPSELSVPRLELLQSQFECPPLRRESPDAEPSHVLHRQRLMRRQFFSRAA